MSNIVTISGIECYEQNGTAYLKLETVARGLGFTETKGERDYVMWRRVDAYLADLGFGTSAERPDFIPENIFYRLAMKAKNEAAEHFQAKVADEIIPSIRKTGVYISPQIDSTMLHQIAEAMAEKEQQIEALTAETESQRQLIAEYEPKMQYLDTILESTGTMATSQIAADYGMSARNLNKILHEEGIQRNVNGQWILYRKHMNNGYTKSETISFMRSNGQPDTKLNTKWTQKGRLMIHQVLTNRGIIAVMDRDNSKVS